MKYLYEPNKYEINAIICEIYNDAQDEDGFQVKTLCFLPLPWHTCLM